MSDLSTFAEYNKLADLLIEKVSKEDIAECARSAGHECGALSVEVRRAAP